MDHSFFCLKAAYVSNTRELFALIAFDDEKFGITVFGVSGDQNDQLEVKRTMNWDDELRGEENELYDICLDTTSNSLYGVVLQEGFVNRVKELDKLTLKKNSELDTEGLLNGKDTLWLLTSKSGTMALTILDKRYKDNHKWHSVTMYKSRTRLYTVPLDMKTDVDELPWFGCELITETTLLLTCGGQDNKVALVSLPAQQQHHTHASASSSSSSSTEPPIINYLIATGVKKSRFLFWIPSEHPRNGYLFMGNEGPENDDIKIFEVDLEKDLANAKHGQQQLTLRVAENVSAPKSILPLCQIDHSTVFAVKTEEVGNKFNPLLLKLDFSDS